MESKKIMNLKRILMWKSLKFNRKIIEIRKKTTNYAKKNWQNTTNSKYLLILSQKYVGFSGIKYHDGDELPEVEII